MHTQPWWTPADQAELAVLIDVWFWDGVVEHQTRCGHCRVASDYPANSVEGGFCKPLGDALQVIIEWRDRRILHSQAAWLRAAQNVRELVHA